MLGGDPYGSVTVLDLTDDHCVNVVLLGTLFLFAFEDDSVVDFCDFFGEDVVYYLNVARIGLAELEIYLLLNVSAVVIHCIQTNVEIVIELVVIRVLLLVLH